MKSLAEYMCVAAAVLSLCIGYVRMEENGGRPISFPTEKGYGTTAAETQCSKLMAFFRNGRDVDIDMWRRGMLYTLLKNYPEEMIEALRRADNAVRHNVYREIEDFSTAYFDDVELIYAVVTAYRGNDEIRNSIIRSLELSLQRSCEYDE